MVHDEMERLNHCGNQMSARSNSCPCQNLHDRIVVAINMLVVGSKMIATRLRYHKQIYCIPQSRQRRGHQRSVKLIIGRGNQDWHGKNQSPMKIGSWWRDWLPQVPCHHHPHNLYNQTVHIMLWITTWAPIETIFKPEPPRNPFKINVILNSHKQKK